MWGASVPVPLPLLSATRRAGTGVGGSLGTSRGATGLLPDSQCAWQPRLTWSACLANAALYSWLALLHSSKQMFASSLILPFVQREEKSRPTAKAETDPSIQRFEDCCQLPLRAKNIFKCFETGPVLQPLLLVRQPSSSRLVKTNSFSFLWSSLSPLPMLLRLQEKARRDAFPISHECRALFSPVHPNPKPDTAGVCFGLPKQQTSQKRKYQAWFPCQRCWLAPSSPLPQHVSVPAKHCLEPGSSCSCPYKIESFPHCPPSVSSLEEPGPEGFPPREHHWPWGARAGEPGACVPPALMGRFALGTPLPYS